MGKTLLYQLFGIGKIPQSIRPVLEQEQILLSDEGIKGTTTYRKFRSPRRRSHWRREWFIGSVVLTGERLVAFCYSSSIIDIPLEDPRLINLKCSLGGDDILCIGFDPSIFHADWSGTIEYRFFTPQAKSLLALLQERMSSVQ